QCDRCLLRAFHDGGFGQLDLQILGFQPGTREYFGYLIRKSALLQLQRRDVDRYRNAWQPRFLPAAVLLAGLVEHPLPERMDQAAFLGDADEALGRNVLERLRMTPAC